MPGTSRELVRNTAGNSHSKIRPGHRPGGTADDKRLALPFSVDSTLLRELGERLVGRPHIALAELIKNSYDADARHVHVTINVDKIVVEDDGHGMTFNEFRNFWMRIGTPHKQDEAVSPRLRRSLTGSKGIGRLAVQFLGRELQLTTTAFRAKDELTADVNWDDAVQAGELTEAIALYAVEPRSRRFVESSLCGTRIEVRALNNEWQVEDVKALALELWTLQPPYGARDTEDPRSFEVTLLSDDTRFQDVFNERISANLDLWTARVRGKLLPPKPGDTSATRYFTCGLIFRHGPSEQRKFAIENCLLTDVTYDIRIFTLHGRQRFGIAVESARAYMRDFGGVHIYDAGFHLPYYGPDTDWLGIEMDHSHRLSRSALLPDELQVTEGLNNLPTNSRIYGIVHIDTARERRAAANANRSNSGNHLEIQAARDRLVDNEAFGQLVDLVRTALDFYAVRYTVWKRQTAEEDLNRGSVVPATVRDVKSILEAYRSRIPADIFASLEQMTEQAIQYEDAARRLVSADAGLMGSLATAGMNALAVEHESQKQLSLLQSIVADIRNIDPSRRDARERLSAIADAIHDWIERAQAIRVLFSNLLDESDRKLRQRLRARTVLREVASQVAVLVRGVPIDTDGIDESLILPGGTMAEWSAIFQNVFVNATNAMLDSDRRLIRVSSRLNGKARAIIVEDTGYGLDLSKANNFFKPFIREAQVSPDRAALGLGGTGLGLAIVRMIASTLECSVAFVPPTTGFATAFELSWSET
jgi:signal transduction histidine kinase